jgi:hypothetical protein
MALKIEFNGEVGANFYAFLFDAVDKSKAFNPTSNTFETFLLTNQSDFVLVLSEDDERLGYFSYSISDVSNIPATENGSFYLAEVYQALNVQSDGTGAAATVVYDRGTDDFCGGRQFYWDGTQEVDICGCASSSEGSCDPTEIAQAVWSNDERTLTENVEIDEGKIADAVWTRDERTLTQDLECPELPEIPECPDDAEQLTEIQKTLNEILEKLNSTPQRSLPNAQTPRIGQPGSSAQGSGGINIT